MLRHLLPILMTAFLASCELANASTLVVSASGQFSNTDVSAPPLETPGGIFAFRFTVDSNPVVSNVSPSGFDVSFTNFVYQLNNAPVNVAPDAIRFFTAANGGLFTLFFGPESGFVNGVPIPEFEFRGPQAFTGTTAAPIIPIGNSTVSSWTYSDARNFDSRSTPTVTVSVSPAPEPSSVFLGLAGCVALIAFNFRRMGTRPAGR